MAENNTVGWYHRLNGHEFGQTLGDGEGQGSLVCCSPRGCKKLDMIDQLKNNCYFYRFVEEVTEGKLFDQNHTVSKWRGPRSHPGEWVPGHEPSSNRWGSCSGSFVNIVDSY